VPPGARGELDPEREYRDGVGLICLLTGHAPRGSRCLSTATAWATRSTSCTGLIGFIEQNQVLVYKTILHCRNTTTPLQSITGRDITVGAEKASQPVCAPTRAQAPIEFARKPAMTEQKPSETVREFLDRREAELSDEIASLQGQLAPREAELAQIRRAKGALGIPIVRDFHADLPVTIGRTNPATSSPATHEPVPDPASWQGNSEEVAAQVVRQRCASQAIGVEGVPRRFADMIYRYEHMTMKELVLKALFQHFSDGASSRQLREFIRDGWGRDIERENLSPQMSRLKTEGSIEQDEITKKWKLTTQGSLIAIGHWPAEARHKMS